MKQDLNRVLKLEFLIGREKNTSIFFWHFKRLVFAHQFAEPLSEDRIKEGIGRRSC